MLVDSFTLSVWRDALRRIRRAGRVEVAGGVWARTPNQALQQTAGGM